MLSSRPISLNGDVDVEQSILNAKTPGRKALKGRTALQENTLHSGAKTVLSKKNVLQTPFRPGTAHGKKPLVSISVTRPLMDKTPFPNRVAAAGFGGAGPAGKTPGLKLSKLALLVSEPQLSESLSPDVAPLLRPSSARKSLRGRLSGSNFKTPLTKGNYWDVSPGDLEGIGGVAEDAKEETEVAVDEEEEDDEIEYMPPTAVELPYEPPFEMPDYKGMGRALFALGHGGLVDDAADVYYAMDIEQQVDMKQLCVDAGFTSELRDASGLQLPELEDDSPFARKPKASSGPVPQPPAQAIGTGRPQASKSASSIPLTRTSSTCASSRTQPTAAPARPATTTPLNQTRPRSATASSSSSGSRLLQPTIVVAPGQTRTSALRAAKAAAAAAGHSAPKGKANPAVQAARRPVASMSSNTNAVGVPAAGSKSKTQAQVPTQAQAKVQAQTRAIVRSVTSGAISANANVNAHGKANAMGTGTAAGTGVSAGAGTGTTAMRSRSATVNVNMNANANGNDPGKGRLPGGGPASGVKGTGVRPVRGGKADEGDELATALEKAIGDGLLGVSEDFVFDV
ncbi:hypothetical protein V8D89_009644 [Ganoderma adspersum]